MVYLIHFDIPLKHARHYIGFVEGDSKLAQRVARHRAGNGAKLIKAVQIAGIGWSVVRTWPAADRIFERKLKQRAATQHCPICNPPKTT